jgi:two-component system response regulator TctD
MLQLCPDSLAPPDGAGIRVLIAEDEAALAEGLAKALSAFGFAVDVVGDGGAVEPALIANSADVLVLDLGLPVMDGRTVLLALRSVDVRIPVLVLTARDALAECVDVLNAGADDFLSKPVAVLELAARLVALVRRARGVERTALACGPLVLDTLRRQFTLEGQPLELPRREYALLAMLLARQGEPVAKHDIHRDVFAEEPAHAEVVELMVHRLRRRLGTGSVRIVTVRGMGYLIEPC